jgi:hypothetical protein
MSDLRCAVFGRSQLRMSRLVVALGIALSAPLPVSANVTLTGRHDARECRWRRIHRQDKPTHSST